jgi:hypothetical protein
MRHALHALALCIAIIGLSADTAHALTPTHLWSQRFGSTGSDTGNSVAVDASGNVFMTGFFTGTVNFGGTDLVSGGSTDIFVAKYNATGVHQWSQGFGSASADEGISVAADGSGNVIVTGDFGGTVNFGGAGLISAGQNDIFVAKYNSTGVHQWSQRFGSTMTDGGNSVTVDAAANVFVTGDFQGTVNFGGVNLVSAGGADIFVAKYNSAGVHQWSQRFGSTLGDTGYSAAVDAVANVFVTGIFQGTVSFGGVNLVSAGGTDIFLAKYNSAGAHQWSQRFGGTSSDTSYSVAADGSGNVFVAGQFFLTVNFGGSNLVSAGSSDIFVAKYNAAGTHQWSQRFGGTSLDSAFAVAVDVSGNVIVTGFFGNTVNFGGGNFVSAGLGDIFAARYSSAGAYTWGVHSGDTTGESGRGITTDGAGNVFATGNFNGTGNFGGAPLVGAGGNDIYLVKFGPNVAEPIITAITDVGNDQGKKVRIQFARSGQDVAATTMPVTQYEAYRRNDALAFVASDAPPGSLSRASLLDLGWVYAGDVPAHGTDVYVMDAPTDQDSTIALGQHHSVFFIRAATSGAVTYFDSPPDSGYSLDNLAPGVPSNFVFSAGDLSWDESTAADFDFFIVYGSNTDNFGAATVVDYSVAPAMDVTASPYVFYYVTATDFSGNEGKPAKINTLSGVGGTPKSYVLSVSNYPNPFNPRTTVSYTVPSRGRVTVTIYDTRGALVATLFDGERAAGAYAVDWDGRTNDAAGAASGIYFARIEHASGTRSKKMVLLK